MSAASISRDLDTLRLISCQARPVRLTRRGERVVALAVMVALFGLMWLASALGYWLTGVAG